ncbi:uncharacterized protein JCM10292_002019 [Rhodotorula paludigena]|uniref:uncharacterized protein n=1 Tax=Rhodotorula paludigena TaxID=86838 RepID=UPI0031728EC8
MPRDARESSPEPVEDPPPTASQVPPHSARNPPPKSWSLLPAEKDPAEQFAFAPGPAHGGRGGARGAGEASGQGGDEGSGGARVASDKHKSDSTAHRHRHSFQHDREMTAQTLEESELDDDNDGVVLAEVRPAGGQIRSASNSPTPAHVDPLAKLRLPASSFGTDTSSRLGGLRGTRTSISPTLMSNTAKLGNRLAFGATGHKSGARPFLPTGSALPSAAQTAPPAQPFGVAGATQSLIGSSMHFDPAKQASTAKKRPRASDEVAGAAMGETDGISSRRSKSTAPRAGVRAISSGKAGVTASTAGGAALTGSKRRRSTNEPPSVEELMLGLVNISNSSQGKDADIQRLRERLAHREKEIVRLTTEKEKLKSNLGERIKAALVSADKSHEELVSTSTDMRDSLQKLKANLDPLASAAKLKEELASLKLTVSNHVLNERNEIWLERHEETKMAVLHELSEELAKREQVIKFLRGELDDKTGSLAEARSRVDDLESRCESVERTSAHFRSTLEAAMDKARVDKQALGEKLDAALLVAAEREEAQHVKLDEIETSWKDKVEAGMQREDVLRSKWIEAKNEAALRETELHKEIVKAKEAAKVELLQRQDEVDALKSTIKISERECVELKKRITTLEALHAESAATIVSLQADLSEARTNLSTEVEQSASRLKAVRTDHEYEKESLAERVKKGEIAVRELQQVQGDLARVAAERDIAVAKATTVTADEQQLRQRAEAAAQDYRLRIADLEKSDSRSRQELERRDEQLDKTIEAEKQALQQKIETLQALSTGAGADPEALQQQRDDIAELRQHVQDLESALAASADEKEELDKLRESAVQAFRDKVDELEQVGSRIVEQSEAVKGLEVDLAAAQTENEDLLAHIQELEQVKATPQDWSEKEKELVAKLTKEKQEAVRHALQVSKESHLRDLSAKSNEIKRVNNQLAELNRKLNKSQNDLAKARNRQVLNKHIASSVTGDGESPEKQGLGSANGPVRMTGLRPPPELSHQREDHSRMQQGQTTKIKGKTVAFSDHSSAIPRRRPSTTTASKPAKKVALVSESTSRRVTTAVLETNADDDEDEDDADRTLVEDDHNGVEDSMEFSLTQHEDDEEDDEIVNSNTPLPVSHKPKPRNTYSSSKKRR